MLQATSILITSPQAPLWDSSHLEGPGPQVGGSKWVGLKVDEASGGWGFRWMFLSGWCFRWVGPYLTSFLHWFLLPLPMQHRLRYRHLPTLCQQDPPLLSPLFFTPAGTNDKAGSPFYLLRWMSPLSIKKSLAPLEDWSYPSVDTSTWLSKPLKGSPSSHQHH